MTVALIDAVGSRLASAGVVGGSTGWTLRKLTLPATPDQVVTIYPTGGLDPEADKLRPTFQVAVRGAKGDVDGPYRRAVMVQEALHRVTVAGLGLMVATQSTPNSQGRDDNDRGLWGVNFRGHEA